MTDFGLATVVTPHRLKILACGSAGYLAPEMYGKSGYSYKADMFSLGVILFTMYFGCYYCRLTGEKVFKANSFKELLKRNMECEITFESPIWSLLTSEAKDLTQRMLERDPHLRISAKDALAHPWFTLEHTSAAQLSLPQENVSKYCGDAHFNVESIKPDFSSVKAVGLSDVEQSEVSEVLVKHDESTAYSNVNLKGEEESYGNIEVELRKLNLRKRYESSKEVKALPGLRGHDASNLEESEIAERGGQNLSLVTRVFATKGIRRLSNPLLVKSRLQSDTKVINNLPVSNIALRSYFGAKERTHKRAAHCSDSANYSHEIKGKKDVASGNKNNIGKLDSNYAKRRVSSIAPMKSKLEESFLNNQN